MNKIFATISILIATTFYISSCSNPSDKQKTKSDTNEISKSERSIKDDNNLLNYDSNAPEVELTLLAKGNTMEDMEYDPKELKAKSGSTIVLHLTNQSIDGSMQHNFVLIENGSADKVGVFGAQSGAENEFVQEMPEVLVYTKMLKPGESVTLKFRAPSPGTYQYICTYPGHYSTMQGIFVVE